MNVQQDVRILQDVRVLIVEDEPLVGEMIRGLLEEMKYVVVGIAADGLQAIEMTQCLRPDVVLMDIGLPDMDGVEATRQIYESCPTPVVVLTAYDTPELVRLASVAGVGAYLVKPPKAREIERAITITMARFGDMMELRRLNAELQAEVAERRQVVEALRKSEERYRSLFNGVPVGLYRSTPEGQITDANIVLVQVLGYPNRESLLKVNAAELYVDPEVHKQWRTWMERVGVVRDFEMQLRRCDGAEIWVRNAARAVLDADGRTLYYEGSLEDITLRRLAEETLARRTAQLALISEIGRRVAAELDLDEVLNRATAMIKESFDYHNVGLFIVDREREHVVLRAVAGSYAAHAPKDYRLKLTEGVVGWTATHGKTRLVNDLSKDTQYVRGLSDGETAQAKVCVPIKAGGQTIGVLEVQSPQRNAFDDSDVLVIETLADQIAVAIGNAQLFEQVRAGHKRLRQLTQQLVSAQEEERHRLSRELHDEAGQALTALKIGLELIRADLPVEAGSLCQRMSEAVALTDAAMERIRLLAQDLRPPALDAVGLNPTLEGFCQDFSERTRLCIDYVGAEVSVLPEAVNIGLYRFLQEALTNVVKHANANYVGVALRYDGQVVSLSVEDDGQGLEVWDKISVSGRPAGIGLLGMQERLELLDGRLEITSRPGQGTRLVARVPCMEVE